MNFARYGRGYMDNNCNLTTCRYNKDGKCTNEEKREECVEVSRKVLCIDVFEKEKEKASDTSRL